VWAYLDARRAQSSQGTGPRQRPMSAMRFVTSDSGHDSAATDVPPVQETPVSSPRDTAAAMNDTGKVKRVRPFTADVCSRRDKDQPTAAAAAPMMDDFHRVCLHWCVFSL